MSDLQSRVFTSIPKGAVERTPCVWSLAYRGHWIQGKVRGNDEEITVLDPTHARWPKHYGTVGGAKRAILQTLKTANVCKAG
jgi:hypothetical protein